jgi:hypothetical protein
MARCHSFGVRCIGIPQAFILLPYQREHVQRLAGLVITEQWVKRRYAPEFLPPQSTECLEAKLRK